MIIAPEKYVHLKLVTTPRVARLVGFNVYPIAVPKTGATLPFLVYRRSNVMRERELQYGPLYCPMVGIQISAWALTYDIARELADEVRLCLDGSTGTLANATIQDMRLVSETDDFLDPTQTGSQLPPAYEVRSLYQCRWLEATD